MNNSYRIRTKVGVDSYLSVQLDQDFEYLEILSLKILPEQIYTRPCSDYGVIVGRLTVNGGYGIPNVKVSIFIPISEQDKLNPLIYDLYPYEKITDQNEDGYRYNLLPYKKSYSAHNPTGTFFDREDVLVSPPLIEVYDKYYKYCASTNSSGDFMIFGAPIGTYTLHADIDLSDIGEFSLSPQDLIRMGIANPGQVAGVKFKSSENLNELPQIISMNKSIEVQPLWGQPELCNLGVNRVDFDLTKETKIQITPTAIFIGSLISGTDEDYQKRECKPTLNLGDQCSLIAGPGIIQALRQTLFIDPVTGYPGLEVYDLEQGGQVIDDNGAWMLDVPMNLDYVITNEFGEQVISPDPKVGIPTKGKYRFKIKWVQGDTLSEPIKRGYFLVPNVREYWTTEGDDPFFEGDKPGQFQLISPALGSYGLQAELAEKSYSFSTDWNDYPDPQVAIQCEDYFYELTYNKVYTVSQMMDSYNSGYLLNRKIAIKNILNSECASENNKFPVNDGQYRFDLIFILFSILLLVTFIIMNVIVLIFHIVGILLQIFGQFLGFVLRIIVFILRLICDFINDIILESLRNIGLPAVNLDILGWSGCVVFCPDGWYPLDFLTNVTWCDDLADQLTAWAEFIEELYKKFMNVQVPMLTYPDCELCDCSVGESTPGNDTVSVENDPNLGVRKLVTQQLNKNSFLAPITLSLIFNKTRNLIPNLPDKKILYAPIALSGVALYGARNENAPNTLSLPDGRLNFYRNAFLIKGADVEFYQINPFKKFIPSHTQKYVSITSVAFMYTTPGNSGNVGPTYDFQLRFQNTTDSTYSKGTNWNTIISGMTVTNPGDITIPYVGGAGNDTYVNLGASFNYKVGDNLYVSMDVGGQVSGFRFGDLYPAIASANSTGLLNGLTWATSHGTAPTVLSYSNLRPLIILYTTMSVPALGITPISMFYRAQSTKVSAIISGEENDNNFLVSSKTRVPQSYLFGQNLDYNYFSVRAQNPVINTRVAFSLSLPISERMNLFNLKSKYFNENIDAYHGLGVNRIKVTFNTQLNGGPIKYHYDNTLTLLLNNDQLRKLKPGQLLSFQNPILSRDNNLNGLTDLNQYGSLSVTGTAINTTGETMVNITYANPDGSGDLVVEYNLPQEDGDMYAKFPTDMEYFMVITAMTYDTFSSMCNPNETEFTLNKRYLGNSSKIEILKTEYGCWDYEASSAFTVNSLNAISDGKKQGVVICVRGVDPNSTREINKYDLSWLFGYNTDSAWGQRPELIVEGEYYLNHPIKGNINSASHDISSNLETEIDLDYLNGATNTIYHDSFRFKPAFSGYASFSSYTTNLPMYYSSFDKLTPSRGNNIYKPDNFAPPFSEAIQTPYEDGFVLTTNCLPNQSNLFVKEFKRQTNLNLLTSPPAEDGVCYPCTDYNPVWISSTGTGWNYGEWGYCVKPDPNHMNINTPNHSNFYSYNTLGPFGTITAVANAYWVNSSSSLRLYKSYSLVAYSGDSYNNSAQFSAGTTVARIEIRDEKRNLVNSKGLYYEPTNNNRVILKIKILTFQWDEVAIVKLDSLYSAATGNILNISFWDSNFWNTMDHPVNFLGESLIPQEDANHNVYLSGNSSFIDFDIEVDYISTNIILMFPVPSNSNMVVGGTALDEGIPVLMFISRAQKYLPDQLNPIIFPNGSIFLPISTFPVNKTKITMYNEILVLPDLSEITLYACGYIKTSGSTLYVSVFDDNGILIKTFGPTSADNVGTYINGSEILTTDIVTSFSLDFNPLSKELIVCWINNNGQIYYKVFNVLFSEAEISPGNFILVPNITLKTNVENIPINQTEVTFDSVANGIPSDVILKVNRLTKEIAISWQTPLKGVFTMKYFNLFAESSSVRTDFPSPKLLPNSNHTQTGTTIYDIATNYGTPSSFNITFKENTNNGVLTKQVYSIFIDREPLNRGYYQYEFLEGGGVMYLKSKYGTFLGGYNSQEQYLNNFGKWAYEGYYYSPTYDKSKQIEISITEDTCKLIMRSDRLPTSTTENKVDSSYGGNSSFTLHANQNFTAYLFDENGRSFSLGGAPKMPTISESLQDDTGENFATNVLATTTCDGLVPLDCYTTDNDTIGVKPSGDDCYYNGIGKIETDKIMKGGCYVLVTKVWDTLGKDLILLGEWRNRINVNFAACRNVFGHVFRNNWINGTLFAFPIKNDRSFTPIFTKKFVSGNLIINKVSTKNPVGTKWGLFFEPNSPYSKYCKDTVRLHSKTNEFYYRSSPFLKSDDENPGAFIGIENDTYEAGDNGRNNKFIKFPTTIMDLGPRSKYLQEIVMSDDLDGYNIGNINKSSFSDVSPLLNLFILSRTVTKEFTFLLTSFFSRSLYIDGDYAQMVATNSQVGIAPFDETNYGNQTGSTSNPVFYNKIGPTFGVFYNSDLEIRDLVSPRRTLINGDVPNNFCAFNELSNFSQRIPMYQWEIKQKLDDKFTPWIFGNETNNWYTDLVTTTTGGPNPPPDGDTGVDTFFSYKYQSLDRLETQSRFFRTNIDSKTNFFKGYIYAVSVGIGPITGITINNSVSAWSRNSKPFPSDNDTLVTFGTPFYFYFGLKNGKTAIDLFKRKWINSENVII